MKREHVISDEVLDTVQSAINRNENWMAYNNSLYFIEKEDVRFFKEKTSAIEFAGDNLSDYDQFSVIHIQSIEDVLKQIYYGENLNKELIIHAIKNMSIMNEKNFDYLKDNIKYHGFGETLNPELEKHLKAGAAEFSLLHKTEVNKKNIEATLHFRKPENADIYFFNKYDVRAETEKKGEMVSQTFYLNKGHGVTLKEAYNLLNGRSVYKELIDKQDAKYHAWIQLDFAKKDQHGNFERKQYHQNYGFDIKEALSYYPVKEMLTQDDANKLIRSLEKGNRQQVNLQVNGKDEKLFIEANPQYKTLTLYSMKGERLDHAQRQEYMNKPEIKDSKLDQTQSVNRGKELKQNTANSKFLQEDDLEGKQKKRSRRKGMST